MAKAINSKSKVPKNIVIKKTVNNKNNSISKSKLVVAKSIEQDKKTKETDKNIYPIGKFIFDEKYATNNIQKYIEDIEELPDLLKSTLKKIDKKNKNNRYRDGGWTVEQIIHHTADSHINAFLRFKLALTEVNPTIKPYNQNLFAESADVFVSDLKSSIRILRGVHHRWTVLLQNMSNQDFNNTYTHPEYKAKFSLLHALALYAWHGKHHVAQIKVALKRKQF